MAVEEFSFSYLLGKKLISIYNDDKEITLGTFVGWRDNYFYYLDYSNMLCEVNIRAWRWKFV